MNYSLIKEIIDLAQDFEKAAASGTTYPLTKEGFMEWVTANLPPAKKIEEPDWEGKGNGRSPEGAISTLLVHMNRYAKNYSRAAISGSEFATQEDFIYLINLRAHGTMTKMELIRRNIQDKPTGMQIITRLMGRGWIEQVASIKDKRSKELNITDEGIAALELQMPKIRMATNIVAGPLTSMEKMDLIRILNKLEGFHNPIFNSNIAASELLSEVNNNFLYSDN